MENSFSYYPRAISYRILSYFSLAYFSSSNKHWPDVSSFLSIWSTEGEKIPFLIIPELFLIVFSVISHLHIFLPQTNACLTFFPSSIRSTEGKKIPFLIIPALFLIVFSVISHLHILLPQINCSDLSFFLSMRSR